MSPPSDPLSPTPLSEQERRAVLIPKDPEKRAALAQMAGLTDEERLAINQWCDLMARENKARQRRGLEAHGNDQMP